MVGADQQTPGRRGSGSGRREFEESRLYAEGIEADPDVGRRRVVHGVYDEKPG